MPYRQILDLCFADRIGAGGLDAPTWAALQAELAPVVRAAAQSLESGGLAPIGVARRRDDLPQLIRHGDAIAARARDVLVLGIGGSSLGGQTLYALRAQGGMRRRLHFVDNIDPMTWQAVLDDLDLPHLHVIAVSKSGGTAETLAQTLLMVDRLKKGLASDDIGEFLKVITEPGDRPMRR
jgi:glucose-6-phosphate isomerase